MQYTYDYKTEGKEPFHKMMGTMKLALLGSVVTGGLDAIMKRPATDFQSAFLRGGKHVLMWSAVTTTFTTTVLFLTNARKKDDPWNYFFGANASCAVFYSFTRNGPLAFSLAMLSSLLAAGLKKSQLLGYDPLTQDPVRKEIYVKQWKWEYSPDVRYNKEN